MKRAVLSLSGGMDSTALLIRLIADGYQDIRAISFNYGQKHSVELKRAKANIKYLEAMGVFVEHTIVDLSSFMGLFDSALIGKNRQEIPEGHYAEENMKQTVVPNRNAIFSALIYGYALSIANRTKGNVEICLGIHAGDHTIYPDTRPEFRDALEHAFKIGNWDSERVSYYTPYLLSDKTGILKDTLENCKKLDFSFDTILSNTITSYNPDCEGRSSGTSGSDVERIEAFINIGRKDPIEYQQPWEAVKENALRVLGR